MHLARPFVIGSIHSLSQNKDTVDSTRSLFTLSPRVPVSSFTPADPRAISRPTQRNAVRTPPVLYIYIGLASVGNDTVEICRSLHELDGQGTVIVLFGMFLALDPSWRSS